MFMITSRPPAAAASTKDPGRGGGGLWVAAVVGFSPEIGAAIDNRTRGANVAVTYTLYIHTYNLYTCVRKYIYISRRREEAAGLRHPHLRPADYSRAPASLAFSPATARWSTTVTTIPLSLYNLLNSSTAAVLLSVCLCRLSRSAVGGTVPWSIMHTTFVQRSYRRSVVVASTAVLAVVEVGDWASGGNGDDDNDNVHITAAGRYTACGWHAKNTTKIRSAGLRITRKTCEIYVKPAGCYSLNTNRTKLYFFPPEKKTYKTVQSSNVDCLSSLIWP